MKAMDAVKIGGIVFAGVAAYLLVTRTVKAGDDVVAAVKKIVTEDLNPASDKNVIYKNLPESWTEKIGNKLGQIFDPEGHAKYQENLKSLDDKILKVNATDGLSNTSDQAKLLVGNQSNAETNRLLRYEVKAATAETAANMVKYGNPYGYNFGE